MLGLRRYAGVQIDLFQGDITTFVCDAMGNAANAALSGGGGVDGAIHKAGGPSIMEELRARGRGCPTGEAVVTRAGDLPATHVIHAVGPVWDGGESGEPSLLASAYRSTFAAADAKGCAHLAVPSLSTGAYRFPLDRAAPLAMETLKQFLDAGAQHLRRVTFVLFNEPHHRAFQEALFASFPEEA